MKRKQNDLFALLRTNAISIHSNSHVYLLKLACLPRDRIYLLAHNRIPFTSSRIQSPCIYPQMSYSQHSSFLLSKLCIPVHREERKTKAYTRMIFLLFIDLYLLRKANTILVLTIKITRFKIRQKVVGQLLIILVQIF